MFYTVDALGVHEKLLEEISPQDITAGYLTMDQLEDVYQDLGFSEAAVRECTADKTHFRNSLDIYDDFSFGILNIVDVTDIHQERDRIALFLKKNLFVMVELVDADGSNRDLFEKAIGRYKTNVTLEKVIYGILERLLANGYQVLERAEMHTVEMEKALVNGRLNENMNREIFDMKTRLTIQKNYYEQLVDIGEQLQENENELFEEDYLRYFTIFTVKAARLCSATQTMCENLVHVREAYQAAIDYSVNKIMKLFTVVTTVFLPLTLIVGWYGMNFTNMPLINWRYGYLCVVLLSIGVAAGCLAWFKKKKLL